jgi:hypothetical protein
LPEFDRQSALPNQTRFYVPAQVTILRGGSLDDNQTRQKIVEEMPSVRRSCNPRVNVGLLKVSHQLVIGAANWLMTNSRSRRERNGRWGALAANHRRFARGSGAFAPIHGRWASSATPPCFGSFFAMWLATLRRLSSNGAPGWCARSAGAETSI